MVILRIWLGCYSPKSTSSFRAKPMHHPFSMSGPFAPICQPLPHRRYSHPVSLSALHLHSAPFWRMGGVKNICDIHGAILNLRLVRGPELIFQRGAHGESGYSTAFPLFLHPAILLLCADLDHIFLHLQQGRCINNSGSIFNERSVIFHNLAIDRRLFAVQGPNNHFLMALPRADSVGHPLRPLISCVAHLLRIDVLPLPPPQSPEGMVSWRLFTSV
ncbi:hypothetical protein BJY52DRAFT_1284546 [Lactarius psammicola]|nr:hypothetical protein BJY52DRAFT_1284546 [Lactarius psammicola]